MVHRSDYYRYTENTKHSKIDQEIWRIHSYKYEINKKLQKIRIFYQISVPTLLSNYRNIEYRITGYDNQIRWTDHENWTNDRISSLCFDQGVSCRMYFTSFPRNHHKLLYLRFGREFILRDGSSKVRVAKNKYLSVFSFPSYFLKAAVQLEVPRWLSDHNNIWISWSAFC